MEIEKLFIGDIYRLTNIDYIEQKFEAIKVRETVLYQKGYIETIYMDLRKLKKYPSDFTKIQIGDCFVNEQTLRPYVEILQEKEKEEDQTVRKVLARYKKYNTNKNFNKTCNN